MGSYSSFDHLVASICPREGRGVLMSMFTVYVDDSGTDNFSRIVAGAFCVASVKDWKKYEAAWKAAERRYGFKHFHMTEFAACKKDIWCRDCRNGKTTQIRHPWREWSNNKRWKVLGELVGIVIKYVSRAEGIAITKQDYDNFVLSGELKQLAPDKVPLLHHTFVVQCCGGVLQRWRAKLRLKRPMKYIFDTTDNMDQRQEISDLFMKAARLPDAEIKWGMTADLEGHGFESRKTLVQLLAPDMLAWTAAQVRASEVFNFPERPEAEFIARRFTRTKKITISCVTRDQMRKWTEREAEYWKTAAGSGTT